MHWHGIFSEYKFNMKKTWENINIILNRKSNKISLPDVFHHENNTLSSSSEIANEFNKFYVNIGHNLSQNMGTPPCDHNTYLKARTNNSNFFMYPTCEQEVLSVINNMKSKMSTGHDALPPKLVKETSLSILSPLTHIINLSLKHGVVPKSMKLAKVIPIFKSGEMSQISNYRPISLLPTFSKVLEKIVYTRLYKYFTKYDILIPAQYGFRDSLSTDLAILELQDRVAKCLSSGSWCLGIFLDLSKAFDTINHDILISKLEYYGVRGVALDWFKDYLNDRKQYSLFNSTKSNIMSVTCGIPQGSILGPLLFLIYINDIPSVIKHGHPILFADDTNIIYSDKNLGNLCSLVNVELDILSDWFLANRLSVNIKKTKYIIFHNANRHNQPEFTSVKISGQALERVQMIEFLGVILHENLSWKPHLDCKANKIAKTIGVLNRLKHQLPVHTLLTLYNHLILPHLQYAITAWGNCPQKYIKRLEILQKKAIRSITKSSYISHTNPLFVKFKILKIRDMFISFCCKLYYRKKKCSLPEYHSLQLTMNVNNMRTRQSNHLYIPRISRTVQKQCLNFKIGTEWNTLPNHLTSYDKSISSFVRALKKYIIQKYDTTCNIANCFSCHNRPTQ
jgi:hypothetical protein